MRDIAPLLSDISRASKAAAFSFGNVMNYSSIEKPIFNELARFDFLLCSVAKLHCVYQPKLYLSLCGGGIAGLLIYPIWIVFVSFLTAELPDRTLSAFS